VSCLPSVVSVSGLFIFILCLVYIMCSVSLDCLSWYCVPYVVGVYGLFIFVLCLVYPVLWVSMDCLSSSCFLCTLCCGCLWIVYLRPVSCVPSAVGVYVLFIFVLCLVYPVLWVSMDCLSSSCVLCTQCCRCLCIVYLRPVSSVHNIVGVYGFLIYLSVFFLTINLY
jgi:hypothetical protein